MADFERFKDGKSTYDIDFEFIDGVARHPVGQGLKIVDHPTHNVYRGRMAHRAGFYEKFFNFREIRDFDIQGEYTGLTSKAMTAPDGMIRIPLNEESSRGSGQIRMLDARLPRHGEDAAARQARGILLDGVTTGESSRLLLQIFSNAVLGPVLVESIRRKGDDGFGEGNFKALFESLERDQIERGVLETR